MDYRLIKKNTSKNISSQYEHNSAAVGPDFVCMVEFKLKVYKISDLQMLSNSVQKFKGNVNNAVSLHLKKCRALLSKTITQ